MKGESAALRNKPIDSAFGRLLDVEQLANVQRLNILRLVGVSVFLALELLPGKAGSGRLEGTPLVLLSCYVIAALMLMLAARKFERIARLSRMAIPVLDMPMLFLIQHFNLLHAAAPRAVGNFTLAIFIIYIILSALSLDRWHLVLATMTAVILQIMIHLQAEESIYGLIGGAFLLFLVTALCDFVRRRRMDMVWSLCGEQLRRERLGRYFSPLVAVEIEKTGEGMSAAQLCEVTVLFSDCAPVSQEDHAARAVRCAMAMQKSLAAFNAAHPGNVPLRMGIGIHTGTAVVGSIGASHRREYTAIGDTVNLAARIEQLCKECKEDILVSLTTRNLAGSVANFREVRDCTVKGRTASVQVFVPEYTSK